jgi:hypothetical protein
MGLSMKKLLKMTVVTLSFFVFVQDAAAYVYAPPCNPGDAIVDGNMCIGLTSVGPSAIKFIKT